MSLQKTEWLCLNCQTKRLLEGSLGEPTPLPLPASQQPPAGAPLRATGAAPPKQKGPQGPGQPSGPPPAKASPLSTKASPQAKPARASEPGKTLSSAQEKKTGIPAKAEPGPKPPPETTVPPGTPKGKTVPRRTEPATPVVKAVPEAPKAGESEVSPTHFLGTLALRWSSLGKGLVLWDVGLVQAPWGHGGGKGGLDETLLGLEPVSSRLVLCLTHS